MNNNKQYIDKMFAENETLVHYVIKRYHPHLYRCEDYEDIVQIGNVGLIKAIKNFNTEYGTCFSTYAVPMIDGEIRREQRDSSIIRFSRRAKDIYTLISSSYSKLINEDNISFDDYINEALEDYDLPNETKDEVIQYYKKEVIAFNTPLKENNSGNKLTVEDIIPDKNSLFVEEVFYDDYLSNISKNYSTRNKAILFGILTNKTQQELGDELGVSQAQISRIIKKIRADVINIFIKSTNFDYAIKAIMQMRSNALFNDLNEFLDWAFKYRIHYLSLPKQYINQLIQHDEQKEENVMTTTIQYTNKKQFNIIIIKAIIKYIIFCKIHQKNFDSSPKAIKKYILDVIKKAQLLNENFENYINGLNKDVIMSFIDIANKYYEYYDYKYIYEIKLNDKPFDKLINHRRIANNKSLTRKYDDENIKVVTNTKIHKSSQNNNPINTTISKIIDLLQNYNKSLIIDV